jgi:hypothetical protein
VSIYIYRNNQQSGPFEENQILQWLASGQLSPEDLAVKQGESDWKPLKVLFPNAPNNAPQQPSGFSNVNAAPVGTGVAPQKKGGSKTVLFLLLGLGGLLLIGAIVAAPLFFYMRSNRTRMDVSNYNSNTSSSNANTTSNALNFQPLRDKSKELAKLTPTLKPESKPVLKGKIVIVKNTLADSEYSTPDLEGIKSYGEEYDESVLESYGLTKDRLAVKPEEIDTLVQVLCRKGSRIGTYTTSQGSVPAYSKTCKVSVINYKDSKIIAQKSFVNSKMEQTVTLSKSDTEYVLLYPYKEIRTYIKGLPKE